MSNIVLSWWLGESHQFVNYVQIHYYDNLPVVGWD